MDFAENQQEEVESCEDEEFAKRKPKLRKTNENDTCPIICEIKKYIEQIECGDHLKNKDPIEFWNERNSIISLPAQSLMSIPATSGSVERLFSFAGVYSKGNRSNIEPELLSSRTVSSYNKF